MRVLTDTHAYLWWLKDDPGLGDEAREVMANPETIVVVSAASIWEIAIKSSLGKLTVDGDPLAEIRANGFEELPMTARHAQLAGALPRHHDDPFDRMLIAQAGLEDLTLISRDAAFAAYDVAILRA